MEEKIIIKGEKFQPKVVISALVAISLCIPVLYFIVCLFVYGDYTLRDFFVFDGAAFIPKLLAIVIFVVALWAIYFTEIVVTDKRVYGKTMFGRRVDLPLDSISAVGYSAFHGISVGTSSGNISFALIVNNEEIHEAINKLLIERQTKDKKVNTDSSSSNADELKKYKDLLDSGIITQEEFDAKKKELLGL